MVDDASEIARQIKLRIEEFLFNTILGRFLVQVFVAVVAGFIAYTVMCICMDAFLALFRLLVEIIRQSMHT